jgi:hypothetical protein
LAEISELYFFSRINKYNSFSALFFITQTASKTKNQLCN